ncbi:MAG TPA: hypothetical protein VKZ54_04135 [Membranihabitans sp.]|nr:hypothetical protein [Membranihabitans sp.]
MKEQGVLRDKFEQLRIQPSDRVWVNIERNLDRDTRKKLPVNRLTMRLAAAVVLVIVAYFLGAYNQVNPRYSPATLEINDQASGIFIPTKLYSSTTPGVEYRKDGRLVPNAQALWEHPLIPAVN